MYLYRITGKKKVLILKVLLVLFRMISLVLFITSKIIKIQILL